MKSSDAECVGFICGDVTEICVWADGMSSVVEKQHLKSSVLDDVKTTRG